MRFDIITIFPEIFSPFLKTGILERAISNGLVNIHIHDLRNFTDDPHKTTDDYPYGGGAGMVMKPEPIAKAIEQAKSGNPSNVVYLTPQGKLFNQEYAEDLSKRDGLILLCGRYRGIDERIRELFIDEEISIGDYILSGGEIPAMVIIEVVSRLIPGVLGNEASLEEETLSQYLLDSPQYTRPPEFMGLKVPDVLLSGNHKEVEWWRREIAIERTRKKRPDLYKKYIKRIKNE
jgi:tRNA (guanine37-N1)-methyltransferase